MSDEVSDHVLAVVDELEKLYKRGGIRDQDWARLRQDYAPQPTAHVPQSEILLRRYEARMHALDRELAELRTEMTTLPALWERALEFGVECDAAGTAHEAAIRACAADLRHTLAKLVKP
jgi:hypothetical protein